jgi:hypothetical protein
MTGDSTNQKIYYQLNAALIVAPGARLPSFKGMVAEMARPIMKQVVDYFPHMVNHGKTILILRNEYGNDGYAFWFSLLELLCKTNGQFYDYNNPASWRLLLAETHVKEDTTKAILSTLAEVEAVDRELYENGVIWVQNLVDNLDQVYDRRTTGKPTKPSYCNHKPLPTGVIANNNEVNGDNNPTSIPNETIPNETIQDNNTKTSKNIDDIYSEVKE